MKPIYKVGSILMIYLEYEVPVIEVVASRLRHEAAINVPVLDLTPMKNMEEIRSKGS